MVKRVLLSLENNGDGLIPNFFYFFLLKHKLKMENQQNFVYSILSVPYLKTEYLQISRNRGLLPPEVLPTSCWELLLWRHGEAGKTQRSRGEPDTSVQTSAFLESNIRSQNTRPHWTFAVPSPECGLAASEKQ